jgi:hypothetical protein
MVGKQQLAMRRSDDAGIFSSFVAREFVGEDRILTSCNDRANSIGCLLSI